MIEGVRTERWKYIRYTDVTPVVEELFDLKQDPHEIVRTYVLGMAVVGLASWIYRAFIFRLVRRPLAYTVTKAEQFGRSAVEIGMAPKGPALQHEAGQFVQEVMVNYALSSRPAETSQANLSPKFERAMR